MATLKAFKQELRDAWGNDYAAYPSIEFSDWLVERMYAASQEPVKLYGYTIEEWAESLSDILDGKDAHDIVADTGLDEVRALDIHNMRVAYDDAKYAERYTPTGRMWTPEDGRLFRIVMAANGQPQGS